MQLGDKVKHKNVYIQGEVIELSDTVAHVKCDGGTYYDEIDNWELTQQQEQVVPVDQVDAAVQDTTDTKSK
jgi:hypothetical protein